MNQTEGFNFDWCPVLKRLVSDVHNEDIDEPTIDCDPNLFFVLCPFSRYVRASQNCLRELGRAHGGRRSEPFCSSSILSIIFSTEHISYARQLATS